MIKVNIQKTYSEISNQFFCLTISRSPLDRDRKRRVGPGGIGGGNKSGGRRAPPECRVFVSNIPFDMKWQELKVTRDIKEKESAIRGRQRTSMP